MIRINEVKSFLDRATNFLLVRRVRQNKLRSKNDYLSNPKTTAIIQFFNKRRNIEKILPRITSIFDEVIVIDDGSLDGSLGELSKVLSGENHFLIRSNDLFEVVMYDRAVNFSRGDVVCLLQDDDIPPDDDGWLRDALRLFDRYPNLQILGGKNGLDVLPREWIGSPVVSEPGDGVRTLSYSGVNHYHFYHKPVYADAVLGIPFMFSVAVNRAPMFIRRAAFLASGGIDQSFRPFQCDDVDACLRAWSSGWQVGLYDAPFNRNVGQGGMRLYNTKEVGEQAQKNWALIYERYACSINNRVISDRVRNLNEELLVANGPASI